MLQFTLLLCLARAPSPLPLQIANLPPGIEKPQSQRALKELERVFMRRAILASPLPTLQQILRRKDSPFIYRRSDATEREREREKEREREREREGE